MKKKKKDTFNNETYDTKILNMQNKIIKYKNNIWCPSDELQYTKN